MQNMLIFDSGVQFLLKEHGIYIVFPFLKPWDINKVATAP